MNTKIEVKPAKWVKADLYCALTGHTKITLQKNKANGVWTEGVHYKCGPEGSRTFYYNIEAIDMLISKHKGEVYATA